MIQQLIENLEKTAPESAFSEYMTFDRLTTANLEKIRCSVKALYTKHNIDLEEKQEQEKYHYKMLKNACLHKVRSNKFFHNEGVESRKNIVFSDDCISMIQFFQRKQSPVLYFIVHMRSSNVIELLGADLLALLDICKTIQDEYCHDATTIEFVLSIAHAHVIR